MLVRNKSTGYIQEIVGQRLIPLLNCGAYEPYVPAPEVSMLDRAVSTAARLWNAARRKPDALAIRR